MKEKEIKTVEEITEPDVKYFVLDFKGNRINISDYHGDVHMFIEYDKDDDSYILHYTYSRDQLYNFAIKGNYVRTWKTFAGARRYFIKNIAKYVFPHQNKLETKAEIKSRIKAINFQIEQLKYQAEQTAETMDHWNKRLIELNNMLEEIDGN